MTLPLRSRIRPVATLSAAERDAMYELMAQNYEAVAPERFAADLARKDEALLLEDETGAIRGFTTLAWNPGGGTFVAGDVLFSGDTIIDRACWGTQELVKGFCRRAGEWRATRKRPLYWFLMSKGHRTFLYLPLFARRFHPHPQQPEPLWEAIADQIAGRLFGDAWRGAEGVVRYGESLGHLTPALAASTQERLHDPWVQYFIARNPGFAGGDELVCLTELEVENLRRTARRAFLEGLGEVE